VVSARRVGQGDARRLLYDLDRKQRLRVQGSNLTSDCQDTYSSTPGCAAPDPVRPAGPMPNLELVLTQGRRSWTLAEDVPVAPDLTAQVEVQLPRDLRPGAATLSLLDRQGNRAQRDLVLG